MINEDQAVVVRKIFDLYFNSYSVDMIMKELASNNIKSPTGKDKRKNTHYSAKDTEN